MVTVVGICAYNEESNIERAVRSVYAQKSVVVDKVIVISSGSTDNTDDVVRKLENEYKTLKLIPQQKREGKNSAINLLLNSASADIIVLFNADNILSDDQTLYKLLEPFSDEKTGIVGGHPMPTNDVKTWIGFASVMLWTMHHYISLITPKIGELIAFRDIGTRLPTDTQSDEDILKMELEKKGYRSVYAPEAVVFNRGPDTKEDFLKQRTRVNIGEIYMKETHDFSIPTWNAKLLIGSMFHVLQDMGLHPFKMTYAAILEFTARNAAKTHVRSGGGDRNIWEQVQTTKKL